MPSPHSSNNFISHKIVHLPKPGAIVRRALRAYLVVRGAVADNPHLRLDVDRDDKTEVRGRRPMSRLRHRRRATLRGADDRGAANTGGQRPVAEKQPPELGPRLSEGAQALATRSPLIGPFGANRLAAVDIRLTLSAHPQPAGASLRGGAPAQPAAAARAGELLPHLRWLLTDSAGTIATVAYQLETCAAEVDDDARTKLYDDVSVLDEELATVKALLGNSIDWDSEAEHLLGGEIPRLEPDDDDEEDDSVG